MLVARGDLVDHKLIADWRAPAVKLLSHDIGVNKDRGARDGIDLLNFAGPNHNVVAAGATGHGRLVLSERLGEVHQVVQVAFAWIRCAEVVDSEFHLQIAHARVKHAGTPQRVARRVFDVGADDQRVIAVG